MLTKKERRACFQHAKRHAIEAMDDVLYQEHHSVMRVDDVDRRDMQAETEKYLEQFLKQIKRSKFEA